MAKKKTNKMTPIIDRFFNLDFLYKILKWLFLIGLVYLLWNRFRTTINVTLTALVLFMLFDPIIDQLEKRIKNRNYSVILFFATLILIISFLMIVLIPGIVAQAGKFIENAPQIQQTIINSVNDYETNILESDKLLNIKNKEQYVQQVQSVIDKVVTKLRELLVIITNSSLDFAGKVFSGVTTFLIALVMAFYMLVDENTLRRVFKREVEQRMSKRQREILKDVHITFVHYIAGLFYCSSTIFVLDFILYSLLGLPYALILAFWGGLMEFIPMIGPFFAIIPALFVAATISWQMVLNLIILFIIVELIESNFIAPKFLGNKMEIPPFMIVFFMTLGAEFGGLFGIILAIPIGTIVINAYKSFRIINLSGS